MTSLFTARRRAEEFAAAVDGGPRGAGTYAPVIDDLLEVATLLRTYEPVAPRAEFSDELRARLMVEAETALSPETAKLVLPVRTHGARERRFVAAASAVVLIGGTTSMAAAAQSALPGEVLYPIKRGIEKVEAQLNLTTAGRGQDLLHQASGRLVEVRGLLSSDSVASAPQVPVALSEFTTQANQGSALLLESFRETRDPETVRSVRTFAAEGVVALEQIADQVPADAQDELADAALALRDIDREAEALCSTCAEGVPDLEIPGIFLARAEVDRALQTAATSQLDNSHPVVVTRDPGRRTQTSADAPAAAAPGSATRNEAPEPPVSVPTPAPAPAPNAPAPADVDPPAPGSLLPSVTVETDANPTKKDPVEVAEEAAKQLDDAVKTLLPDDPSGLLP